MDWDIRENQNRSSELTHYGVKGMKWGIRKEYIPHPRQVVKKIATVAKKKTSTMSTTRKVLLGASVGIATVGLGYMAYQKLGLDYVGGVIKAGTTLHTVMTSENLDYGRKFYASFKNKDVELYRKALPAQRSIKVDDENTTDFSNPKKYITKTYDVQSNVVQNIKYPSNKQAEKIYNRLRKEDSVFEMLTDGVSYNEFNTNLIDNTGESKLFYNKLKSLGYSAIIDVNDQKGMGYKSDRPVIVFDSSGIVKGAVNRLTELDDKTIEDVNSEAGKALANAALHRLAPKTIASVGGYGTLIAISDNKTKSKRRT